MREGNRVKETTTTTGTGNITLDGAVTGYVTFSSVFSPNDLIPYTIAGTSEWEVGMGTVSTTTLTRISVISSSNSNALVNFSAGTKNVFQTPPAQLIADTNLAFTFIGGLCGR